MSEGRIRRNLIPIVTGIVVAIAFWWNDVTPLKINNYLDVISGILAMSSMATSFLLASFSLISTRQNSKFFKILEQLKTDIKLLDRLLITVLGFFVCSILSLIALTLDTQSNNCFGRIVISLTGGFLSFSLIEQVVVFVILFKGLNVMNNDDSEDNE